MKRGWGGLPSPGMVLLVLVLLLGKRCRGFAPHCMLRQPAGPVGTGRALPTLLQQQQQQQQQQQCGRGWCRRRRQSRMDATPTSLLGAMDLWFRTAPYQSAFVVTAFKATVADLLTQTREQVAAKSQRIVLLDTAEPAAAVAAANASTEVVVSCDELSCEEVEVPVETVMTCDEVSCEETTVPVDGGGISLRRTFAFFLYGGLYQGCVQYFIFNVLYPIWFGEGTDLRTIALKVSFDQFVLTPFLCLPCAYLVKALVFKYAPSEGLRRYVSDAKKDLLIKYWILWGPVQCLTFSVVPSQWRVPFIALVSFFWLLILSSITARGDSGSMPPPAATPPAPQSS